MTDTAAAAATGATADPDRGMPMAPQPATFAPSREDVLSTLAFFFGDPASPEKLRDYSEHQAATYHFPDAFYGQNNRIRDTLNNLILKSPQEWQTTVALPFVKIEGTTVEWDELHFDVRLLQRVPVSLPATSCTKHTLLTLSLSVTRSTKVSAVCRRRCVGMYR